jgi:PAP2 superfamily
MDLAEDKRLSISRATSDGARARSAGRRARLSAVLARRPWIAPVALAVLTAVAAVVVAAIANLPLRDPDGIFGERMRLMAGTVALFIALDIVPRALARSGWRVRGLWTHIRAVARERYTKRRTALAVTGVLSFYLTYVAYRNLKGFLPFIVDQDVDATLLELERAVFSGSDPGVLLQDVLGTGPIAYVLSFTYLFYLAFVPISVGFASIWSRRQGVGFWYVMALGLNWTLGVLSYYLLPSLGPIFAFPGLFDALPATGVSALQEVLVEHHALAVQDPYATGQVQSIAAFASLHVSVVFSAALIAHHLRLHQAVRVFLWIFLGLTLLSTVYFGWHYVIDDVAGLAIGAIAVYAGALLTGQPIRRRPSEDEPGDVVPSDEREQDRVDPVEDASVGAKGAAAVLLPRVPLEERFEQVAGGSGDGDGRAEGDGRETLGRPVGEDHEEVEREGAPGDAR